jgi:hypothetical protein
MEYNDDKWEIRRSSHRGGERLRPADAMERWGMNRATPPHNRCSELTLRSKAVSAKLVYLKLSIPTNSLEKSPLVFPCFVAPTT